MVKKDKFKQSSRVQISCHKYNQKPSLVQYIYPISYKIAKKGVPPKKDLPFLKVADRQSGPRSKSDISKVFDLDDTFTC